MDQGIIIGWYNKFWQQYGGREYLYKLDETVTDKEFFMFYDPTWRF